MRNPFQKQVVSTSAKVLMLFFPYLTLITIQFKGKNLTFHIPGSFLNIYILNHSPLEANSFHRYVNCTGSF